MHLRKIQPQDNAQVAHIIRTVMTEFDCVGEGYSIEDPEVDTMAEAYADGRALFLVLENDEGKIIGCGGIAPLIGGDPKVCELKKMYFLKEGRGHGFGRKIIEDLLAKAATFGFEQCYLETVQRMAAANGLYRKMGFSPLEKNMGNTGHCSCDFFYVKTLCPVK